MKFIYFQDLHIKGKNSRNRLGNYFNDILTKLDEIICLAETNKCDGIIDGGDLFESDKPAYNVLDEVADRIEKGKIPLYSLFGNHSMSYGHIENSRNTGLAHLQKRSKYFQYILPGYIGNENSEIQGFEYYHNIEEDIKKNGLKFESDEIVNPVIKSKWKIAILHALVTPNKFFDNVSYILPEQIKTNADLVLLAHYHKPFKKEINGTTFLNIGCCGRDNIDEAKIEPSVLLLDTEKRSYEIIKLKSAKKPTKIFDLARYEEFKANKKDIKDFIESLRDIDLQSMDIGQQITKIGQEQKVDQKVIDYILTKMGELK